MPSRWIRISSSAPATASAACSWTACSSRNRTAIITRSTRRKPAKWTGVSPRKRGKRKRKPGRTPVLSAALGISAIIGGFATLFAVTTILERKGLARIQNRYGPNRVGPFGFLQPAADGIKALIKEDIVPRAADQVVHFLAPIVL